MRFNDKAMTKSFTIFETVIATALLLIFILSFLASLAISFNNLRRLVELRTATLVLQEEVSIVRNLKFSEILTLGDTFTSSGMSLLKDAAGTISKSPYNGQEKILKVTFKLDWTTFEGKPALKSIVTLMTDHGINKK